MANPDPALSVDYSILIGGEQVASGTLAPGEMTSPTFPGVMAGPWK